MSTAENPRRRVDQSVSFVGSKVTGSPPAFQTASTKARALTTALDRVALDASAKRPRMAILGLFKALIANSKSL
jgi:hypothetical protein